MYQKCKEWRAENDIPLTKFLKAARTPRNNKRPRATAKAPADDDEDSPDEGDDDDEGNGDAGVDLIGKKFFISSLLDTHDEGDCLVTEPGTHTDEDTGEEYDMLWYKFHCPDTDKILDECSRVCEV